MNACVCVLEHTDTHLTPSKELVRLIGLSPPPPTSVAIDERRAADKDTVQQMMLEAEFVGLRAIISRLDPVCMLRYYF